MKGLDLSRRYFEQIGRPMLERQFSHLLPRMAIGLVGEGSECLGYDDAYSWDHDFGPGFCIWLTQEDLREDGEALQRAYHQLPKDFLGFQGRRESLEADQRVGVFSIEGFYSRYTNHGGIPVDSLDWFKIPSHYLRTATNGEVFQDSLGRFTEIRQELLKFYPDDVLRKKLAANFGKMGQSGQYNLPRAGQRKDVPSAFLARSIFIEQSLQALALLNRRYLAFYKWAFRDASQFAEGQGVLSKLIRLTELPMTNSNLLENEKLAEEIAQDMLRLSIEKGWVSQMRSDFLHDAAVDLMQSIQDPRLKNMPIMLDF